MNEKKQPASRSTSGPARKPADQAARNGTVPAPPDSVVELDEAVRTEQVRRRANRILEGEEE